MTSLDDRVTAAWTALIRAQKVLLRAVEADLKAAGFPALAWYDVLLELDRPAAADGLRAFDLQARLLLPQYALSRLVRRMEDDGLVATARPGDDARGQIVRLTAKGAALRRAMWPVYADALRRALAGRLPPDDAETLARLLRRLVNDADRRV